MHQKKSINTVENSGIQTIDLVEFAPERKSSFLDLKTFLYKGLLVKEKEFKKQLSETDWLQYEGRAVAVGCSVDAIIPPWTYMLVSCYLEGIAAKVGFCSAGEMDIKVWQENIEATDFSSFRDEKVVVRARFDMEPVFYATLSKKLKPLVKTLMYGEAGLPKVIWKKK